MADTTVVSAPIKLDATSLSLAGVGGNGTGSTTDAASKSLNQTYSNFLTMLTTQLKNQDPLNPMDSKDFTGQLIQMSAAEQSISQTAKIEDMLKLMQASTVNTALNYIGLDVDYTGNVVTYNGTTPVKTSYELPENAASAQISVLNSDGVSVYSTTADASVGNHSFTWDGKDKDGNPRAPGLYTIQVGAQKADGTALKVNTTVPGTVNGVETADGQVYLSINGQKVPINAVKSAFALTAYYPPSSSGTGTDTSTSGNSTTTS